MQLSVNGKIENFTKTTIDELIKDKGLNKHHIVVEYNETVVQRGEWDKIKLKDNDKLEILRFMGGG